MYSTTISTINLEVKRLSKPYDSESKQQRNCNHKCAKLDPSVIIETLINPSRFGCDVDGHEPTRIHT
ncbi:hypothetical protein ACG7TL_005961 [Trametes sanguinea]